MAAKPRKAGTVVKRKVKKGSTRSKKSGRAPISPLNADAGALLEPASKQNEDRSAVKTEASAPNDDQLTFRRARFIDEYMISGIGSQAAILAGFSARRATETACELLKDPVVAAEITRRKADLHAKLGITRERVLTEKAAIAFSDIGEILGEREDGTPVVRPMSEWSPGARKAVRSVRVKRVEGESPYEILEFALWEKPRALEKIEERLDTEAAANRGVDLANLTDKERLRIIAEVLSRGRAAMQAAKAPKKKTA